MNTHLLFLVSKALSPVEGVRCQKGADQDVTWSAPSKEQWVHTYIFRIFQRRSLFPSETIFIQNEFYENFFIAYFCVFWAI